jgi:diguanylate cyclase (GGDEF)-like protein/PAS domain S-box-containing protein
MARDSGLQIPDRTPKTPGGESIGDEDLLVRAEAAPGSDDNLMAGWGWLALLRLGLAVSMAAYALTYRALPDHPAPASLRVEAVSIALALVALAFLQLTPRFRDSRSAAAIAFLIDAVAVLGIISLYDFDPRRYLLALVVVVQAEGGMVLGIRGGVWAWGLTSAAYTLVEGLSALVSGQPIRLAEASLRIGVGLMLAVGGGLLSAELSGERARRMAERRRELRRAQEAETRYRSLVEQIPVVTYVRATGDAGALYVSPRIEAVLGYAPKEWTANPALWLERVHPDDRDKVNGGLEARRRHRRSLPVRVPDDGQARPHGVDPGRGLAAAGARTRAPPVAGRTGGRDRPQAGRAADRVPRLPRQAHRAPQPAMFEEALDLALARARRNGLAVAALFLDLDNFKLVNDSLGHAAGDELLKEMASRLRRAVRDTDVVARQGGDEFLVLLADLEKATGDSASGQPAGSEMAITVASRIHASLQRPFVLLGTEFYVSASLGMSLFPASAGDAPGLWQQADAALLRPMRSGRGGWAV